MNVTIRFSKLVRDGLRFRKRLDAAKRAIPNPGFEWYPYDSFANLFVIEQLLREAKLPLADFAGAGPLLDIGAADGALSFFFESLGHRVIACDSSGTNMNCMAGIRTLKAQLNSSVEIHDLDLDAGAELPTASGAFFLGTLYHLKNPFQTLERLSTLTRYCILSTRVARFSPDHKTNFENMPVAYLVDPRECNHDATNYWMFSPAGLLRIIERAGWHVLATANTGSPDSDPVDPRHDERMFALLRAPR